MDAIEFTKNYPQYLREIELVVKKEYQPIVQKLKQTDPHDLISPDTWFGDHITSRGFVWTLFLKEFKKSW